MRKENLNYIIFITATLVFLNIYFGNSGLVISSVRQGLVLCADVVIPSLYIFIVVCNCISLSKYCDILSFPFLPYFRLLGINSRRIVSYCVLGILGGFATGGIMLDKIRCEFNCNENLFTVLSVIMTGNSPAFIVLAVGEHYLGNTSYGFMLYFSALFSSLIAAFLFLLHIPAQ